MGLFCEAFVVLGAQTAWQLPTEVKVAGRILLDVDVTVLVATTGVAFDSCCIWRQQVGFVVLERVAVHTAATGLFVFDYF